MEPTTWISSLQTRKNGEMDAVAVSGATSKTWNVPCFSSV